MARDYVADVNKNFVSYWTRIADHHPAGASRTFGNVHAVSTGTPVPVFNRVYVFEPSAREDLSRAVSWMADREDPYRVTVAESALAATEPVIAYLDLVEADDPLPGMALSSLDAVPASDKGVDIELVIDTGGLEFHHIEKRRNADEAGEQQHDPPGCRECFRAPDSGTQQRHTYVLEHPHRRTGGR